MKKILGLDLGTNSIGWAVVNADENGNPVSIEGMGSRIIPMGSDKIDYVSCSN
jgi:CRISPR-associated endonuclease Csn1